METLRKLILRNQKGDHPLKAAQPLHADRTEGAMNPTSMSTYFSEGLLAPPGQRAACQGELSSDSYQL